MWLLRFSLALLWYWWYSGLSSWKYQVMDLGELQRLLQFLFARVLCTALLPQPSVQWLEDTNADLQLAYRAVNLDLKKIPETSIVNTLSRLIFILDCFLSNQPKLTRAFHNAVDRFLTQGSLHVMWILKVILEQQTHGSVSMVYWRIPCWEQSFSCGGISIEPNGSLVLTAWNAISLTPSLSSQNSK